MGSFNALADAIKALTKTIEDNQNNLSDRLQEQALKKKVASGEMTESEAFEKQIDMAKGEMIACFCTHCGSKIALHEKFDNGFCQFCGEMVGVQEALRGDFSSTAIENIDGKDLFVIATSKATVNMELVAAAAKKNDVGANRMLAYHSICDGDYKTAYKHAKIAANQKDIDSKVYLLLAAVCINKEDCKEALSQLKKISMGNLQTEEAKKTHKLAIETMTEQLAQQERERRRIEQEEEWRRQAIVASLSTHSTPTESEEHGPLATAQNCGMPFIDVSGM